MTCDTWHVTRDTWHVTRDTWQMTHDTWHVTRDMWHVTCDMWHVSPVTCHLSHVITRTATATDPPLCNMSSRCTVGWTENTQKPDFFEKRKNLSKIKNKKAKWRYANISDTPFDQRSLILREAWFLGCDPHTNRQTDIATYWLNRPKGRFSEKLREGRGLRLSNLCLEMV